MVFILGTWYLYLRVLRLRTGEVCGKRTHQYLSVDEQVEHVVALSAHLQPHLHPVQRRRLEKLRRLERPEQVSTNKGGI